MARTKEFDREQALQRAIRLFSQQGYSGTSTDDLMRTMGIGRQSMYDTFGDKRALFLTALREYATASCTVLTAELQRPGPPLEVIRKALISFAERKDMVGSEGCMGLNAVSEFGLRDEEVTRTIRTAAFSLRRTLRGLLLSAAKAGKSRKALRDMASFAGGALSKKSRFSRSS